MTDTTQYDRVMAFLDRQVAELNAVIGGGVTFGYIGNLDARIGDDRRWYVFLPHPGRVGTSEDRFGGFPTGSVEGARDTVRELNAAIRMATFLKQR